MAAQWKSLEDLLNTVEEAGPFRICIVTPDLLGPVKNGGIGTACGYLAHALKQAGHDVEILFCQTGADDIDPAWTKIYAEQGIRAENAAAWQKKQGEFAYFPDLPHLAMSKTVYDWLRLQPAYNMILFMEWQAAGFYSLHAKACGLAFSDTALVTVIHSPSYWHNINNGAVAANPIEACLWHMERRSIAMSDAVISPSRYMLDWVGDRLCKLPPLAFAQPNLLEWDGSFRHQSDAPIDEIIFFGRLEYRKGLEQFCAALDRLAEVGKLPPKITFLGKGSWLGHEHSVLHIANRAEKWRPSLVSLETGKDHKEAVAYICGAGRLAVMPSMADNSPYTVYECLAAGVPFLARDVGGIGEFLQGEDRAACLFGDNPADLAARIAKAVGCPPARASLAINGGTNARAWREGLPRLARLAGKERENAELPFISVILSHYNRPRLLIQAVESLLAQDYQNFEVVLADDGSDDPAALRMLAELEQPFAARGWRILRLSNGHAAAARNRGAAAARGQWLLFFDDDNVAMPDMLGVCAQAASHRDGGYLPIMFQVFEGNKTPNPKNLAEIFLPTGDAVAYGALVNTLADTTALVHKRTFENAGGFRQDYGIGHEDYELFLRLALMGEPCAIIPEPLFWYRRAKAKSSVQLNTNAALNRMRSLRPFLEMLPPHLAELALMTHGMGAMLRMYPDPDRAASLDLPVDIRSDPSSPANMAAVANILAVSGHKDLAEQILLSLPGDDDAAKAGLLRSRALAAAKDGDIKAIRAILAEFDETGLPDAEAAPICQAILDNLELPAEKLKADIISRLAAQKKKSALAWLLLAEYAAQAGRRKEYASCFIKALAAAEEIYTQARPDVGGAIKARSFICCLHHYCLHGLGDNMAWPERPMFRKLLRRHADWTKDIAEMHMQALAYEDEDAAAAMLKALSDQRPAE